MNRKHAGRLRWLCRAWFCAVSLASVAVGHAQQPVPENYWPHRLGATWDLDRVTVEWAKPGGGQSTTVRFTCGGPQTLDNGVQVQPLSVQVTGEVAAVPALHEQLRLARPRLDARGALAAPAVPAGASSGLVIYDEGLLRVAPTEAAYYLDAPARRTWLFLDSDLAPGHAFRMQLVPTLADSVFLDGTVVGLVDLSTPEGSFAASLLVRYFVDYGWADFPDSTGTVVGRVRGATHGEIFFAPGVGPVLARETFVPRWQWAGDLPPATLDSTFAELRLVRYDPGISAVSATSWSAIKQRYR